MNTISCTDKFTNYDNLYNFGQRSHPCIAVQRTADTDYMNHTCMTFLGTNLWPIFNFLHIDCYEAYNTKEDQNACTVLSFDKHKQESMHIFLMSFPFFSQIKVQLVSKGELKIEYYKF